MLKVFPDSVNEKLGFPALLERVRNYCVSEEAKDFAMRVRPLSDPAFIERLLNQTAELKDVLQFDDALPFGGLPFVRGLFTKAESLGAYLNEEDFVKVREWLQTVAGVRNYFEKRKEKYPEIARLMGLSEFNAANGSAFIKEINVIIGPDGAVFPNASPELQRIHRAITEKTQATRQLLERILREARQNGWTDQKEMTIRNERLVIPLSADFKGKIKGLIHDVSGSGQTVFMEPLDAVTLNNEVRELRLRQRNEIIRLLTVLTTEMRPFIASFRKVSDFITQVDFIRAKAKLALDIKAVKPQIQLKNRRLFLRDARHPLLVLQKGFDAVVPLMLALDTQARIIVISGPNAGGKSVALKTVGLCQVMLQAGMLVPTHENSVFPIFDKLFIDMGDDQSIQNDLSTYSAHLEMMRIMLEKMDARSLFLIDEFGSGTDPQFGGPIAESMLEEFVKMKSLGVATTHFSNLKDFAEINHATVNAAMRFDLTTIAPTYELEQGVPGASYALDIAGRVGISTEVIERAKIKIGSERVEVERLLAKLTKTQEELERKEALIEKLQKETEQKNVKLTDLLDRQKQNEQELQEKRKKILEVARQESAQMLKDANVKIENVIRQIREKKAEKDFTRLLRSRLQEELNVQVEKAPKKEEPVYEVATETNIAVGDWVRLKDSENVGRVLEVTDKRCVVALGELRTTAKLKEVVKVTPAGKGASDKNPANYLDPRRLAAQARQLDVRGLRVDEALIQVDKFMDDIILSGLRQFQILHGKGGGMLRTAIRAHLRKSYPQIKKLIDAPNEGGGSGITICEWE